MVASINSCAVRAHPEGAVAIFEHGPHPHVLKALGFGYVLKRISDVGAKTLVRPNPKTTAGAPSYAPGHITLQTFGFTQGYKLSVPQSRQATNANSPRGISIAAVWSRISRF